MRRALERGILPTLSEPPAAVLAIESLAESRIIGMNVIRAKCPNCWETDDCEIVETKNWYGKDAGGQGSPPKEAPAGSGYNLKCPTCHGIFWHEIRGGAKPA
jgi:hypothetical protein